MDHRGRSEDTRVECGENQVLLAGDCITRKIGDPCQVHLVSGVVLEAPLGGEDGPVGDFVLSGGRHLSGHGDHVSPFFS